MDERDPADGLYTPTTANQAVQQRLRGMVGLRVRGEVSQPKLSNGHLYFELKDRGSRLRAVMWRSALSRSATQIRDGDDVICTGDIDLWVQGGYYSLQVRAVERAGLGERFVALQRLRAQLQEEGLLDASRKRGLPALPRRVGLVTAPTGAALRDMLRVLHERFPVAVLLAPVRVQGPEAAGEIARALRAMDSHGGCDVIIVGRGGGSIEDLWAFQEEAVARAIAACQTPVVSAVGHESDVVLSDLVADVRAATPTAAAEMVVPRLRDLLARLAELRLRQRQVLVRQTRAAARELTLVGRRLAPERLTTERTRMVDALRNRSLEAARVMLGDTRRRVARGQRRLAEADPRRRLRQGRVAWQGWAGRLARVVPLADGRCRRRLDLVSSTLPERAQRALQRARSRLALLLARLQALDPRSPLIRGYALVQDAQGRLVRDAAQVAVGDRLAVQLGIGGLAVDVAATRESVQTHGSDELDGLV